MNSIYDSSSHAYSIIQSLYYPFGQLQNVLIRYLSAARASALGRQNVYNSRPLAPPSQLPHSLENLKYTLYALSHLGSPEHYLKSRAVHRRNVADFAAFMHRQLNLMASGLFEYANQLCTTDNLSSRVQCLTKTRLEWRRYSILPLRRNGVALRFTSFIMHSSAMECGERVKDVLQRFSTDCCKSLKAHLVHGTSQAIWTTCPTTDPKQKTLPTAVTLSNGLTLMDYAQSSESTTSRTFTIIGLNARFVMHARSGPAATVSADAPVDPEVAPNEEPSAFDDFPSVWWHHVLLTGSFVLSFLTLASSTLYLCFKNNGDDDAATATPAIMGVLPGPLGRILPKHLRASAPSAPPATALAQDGPDSIVINNNTQPRGGTLAYRSVPELSGEAVRLLNNYAAAESRDAALAAKRGLARSLGPPHHF